MNYTYLVESKLPPWEFEPALKSIRLPTGKKIESTGKAIYYYPFDGNFARQVHETELALLNTLELFIEEKISYLKEEVRKLDDNLDYHIRNGHD